MKVINKKNKDSDVIASTDKNISIWQIFACFIVINLVIINVINYWQPLNKKDTSLKYNKTQNALVAAYDLQRYFNDFKNQPDNNSYALIQKSIKLVNDIELLGTITQSTQKIELTADTNNLNKIFSQVATKVPSFRTYQQQVDKIIKINKDLKQANLDNLEAIKSNPLFTNNNVRLNRRTDTYQVAQAFDLTKDLSVTSDKINSLLLVLKYNFWLSEDNVAKYQNVIEEIGLEIEQINNHIQVNSPIAANLNELFNNLNLLMPMLLEFTETNTQLFSADKYLNNIIDNLKSIEALLQSQINDQNNFDDKTIIIFTLLGATLLLSVLIFLAKATDKTKKVYKDYKNKKEVYLLSHNKTVNATNVTETSDHKDSQDHRAKKQILETETVE